MRLTTMSKTSRILLILAVPVTLLCLWALVGEASSPVAPPPQTWMTSAVAMLRTGELQAALVATLTTVLLATCIAGVAGVTIGVTLGARPAISDAVAPTFEFLRSLPPPTIVPVAMLLIGSSTSLGVSVVSLAAVWPVLLNVMQATRTINPTLTDVSRTLKLSTRSRLTNIYAPSILPSVISGLRVAVPLAIIVALLVEMLATRPGIGRLLLTAQRDFDAPVVFALLLTVGLIGVGLNLSFDLLERFVSRRLPVGR
jgi:ABC-type nitrate/sulfonate/bicarbonate transport system permease component